MEGAPSIVYALEGIRIRKAILSEAAQKKVKRIKTVTDENTEQVWHLVSLSDVWVPDKMLRNGSTNLVPRVMRFPSPPSSRLINGPAL